MYVPLGITIACLRVVSLLTGIRRVAVSKRPGPKTKKLAMYAAVSKLSNTVCQAGNPWSSFVNGIIRRVADACFPIVRE